MKYTLSGLYNAYMAESLCCLSQQAPKYDDTKKPLVIEYQQPRLVAPPIPASQPEVRSHEWVERTKSFASRASSRGSFSVRRTLNAYNGPRRPRISGPTEFRHVENALPRRTGFRPLELSIYMPQNRLSSLMSHFAVVDDTPLSLGDSAELPYPPAAFSDSRSETPVSFQIARKPVRSSSRASGASEWTAHYKPRPESLSTQQLLEALESDLPKPPAPARLRSMTEPPTYQRVKSALHEKYELEQKLKDIEETIEERKSIYMSSRPTSRALSRRESIYSDNTEPMPPPPDMRSFTPVQLQEPSSFAARVILPHADRRPRTAPTNKTVHIPTRLKSFTEASAAFTATSPSSSSVSSTKSRTPTRLDRALPPPPPLPLVLNAPPPLRKKKSFSSVSKWLFPANEHARNGSLDSVTNTPKQLTSREGFYQCVDIPQTPQRLSTSTISTISTLESELDEPIIPNPWTPDSSPGMGHKREIVIRQMSIDSESNGKSLDISRERNFVDKEQWKSGVPGHRDSVGVAF